VADAPTPNPPGYEDLPNPRGFEPVPLPRFPLIPDPATSPTPDHPDRWPRGERFDVWIPLPDGVELFGLTFLPASDPAPFIVLLHMWGMDSGSWDRRAPGFLDGLGEAGYAWCALDLRWHGRSGGEPHCATYPQWVAAMQLTGEAKIERMARLAEMGPPLGANVRFLPDLGHVLNFFAASGQVDHTRTALIGASVGANCAWVASSLYGWRTHICISPWYPAPGWSLMGREVPDFRPRDCLFIADTAEAPEAWLMAARTGGSAEVLEVPAKEHGVGLLREPAVAQWVMDHLKSNLAASPTP